MRNEDLLVIVLLTGFIVLIFYIKTHATNKPLSSKSRKETNPDDTERHDTQDDSSG